MTPGQLHDWVVNTVPHAPECPVRRMHRDAACRCERAKGLQGVQAYRACVEALRKLIKFAHLYSTSSDEERRVPAFGVPLTEALPRAIADAVATLALAEPP